MIQTVEMARKAGARIVYLASAAPPVRHQNVALTLVKTFVAKGRTEEEINEFLGSDGLVFQNSEALQKIAQKMNPLIDRWESPSAYMYRISILPLVVFRPRNWLVIKVFDVYRAHCLC